MQLMPAPLVVCLAGHVDHGKSSLLGRLRHELDPLPEGKAARLDTRQLERDPAVTLDATCVHVRARRRDLAIIAFPGPLELVRNMVAGAVRPTAALLVVDGQLDAEAQTCAHAALLRLLGVRGFVVAVNNMDALDWSESRFHARRDEIAAALGRLGVAVYAIVPTSARDGGNIVARSPASWWNGPTLVEALEALPEGPAADAAAPVRLPIQDVHLTGSRRVVAGRVAQGALRAGDELMVLPSGERAHVATLEGWSQPLQSAVAGDSVALTFAESVIVERGDLLCAPGAPARLTPVFDADVFWLGREPLAVDRRLELIIGTRAVAVRIAAVVHTLDGDQLAPAAAHAIVTDGLGRVTLRCDVPVALDDATECFETGHFALADAGAIVGGGLVDASGYPDQRRTLKPGNRNVTAVDHHISAAERGGRSGHVGAIVWLTGLSGAGKSTLAMALERALFDRGWGAYAIDGDNVRRGLNADLGFSPQDRQENIRRIGEVAALFADAGLVCITAFISPFDDDRAQARAAAGHRLFLEVYVKSELATCEARDPKGLYGKARRGEIKSFTGIDSPYEEPSAPDLVIDTQNADESACIAQLVSFVVARCGA
jgi:bifunctional enzyme CysN/CysC